MGCVCEQIPSEMQKSLVLTRLQCELELTTFSRTADVYPASGVSYKVLSILVAYTFV